MGSEAEYAKAAGESHHEYFGRHDWRFSDIEIGFR
jgi:hypothetical protein